MAEFPDLGKHCEFENCKVLDFLPFLCSNCSRTYCVTHKESDSHDCLIAAAPVDKIYVTPNVESSCSKCSFSNCKNRELIPIICQFCDGIYCLTHRHQQDHDCEKLGKSEKVESKTSLLVKSILSSKSGSKNESKPSRNKNATKINAQVNLLKLKLNAVGDKTIPSSERLFLNVILPTSGIAKAFFFSKMWTLGRVVDYVAAHEKLQNLNNVATAKKLKFFRENCEDYLPTDSTMGALLANEILFNGQNLCLKYNN